MKKPKRKVISSARLLVLILPLFWILSCYSSKAEGVAGGYAGVLGDRLIIAGGTDFEQALPWKGGVKSYYRAIWFLEEQSDGSFLWIESGYELPEPLAYGATISTSEGLICIGGENGSSPVSLVFRISLIDHTIQITPLPDLPEPLSSPAASLIGSTLYVAGGIAPDGPSDRLYLLDLKSTTPVWVSAGRIPLPLSHATMVTQSDGNELCLYLLGGRSLTDSLTTFYSSVWKYSPTSRVWSGEGDILDEVGQVLPLAAATGVTSGSHFILLVGGDPGIYYNQTERILLKASRASDEQIRLGIVQRRDSLMENHGGFRKEVLLYNTITRQWSVFSYLPDNPPVTTTAFWWNECLVVPSGEIRPGVRTRAVQVVEMPDGKPFGVLNYIVLFLYFVGMIFIGFLFMRRNRNTDEFFKAGGRIPWWAAGISIFATTLSAITFLAIPAKTYATDWRMFLFNLSIIFIAPVIIRYYLPFFRRLNLSTAYEYLELRFNRGVRYLASALFILFMITRVAIVLFLPALALNAVTGINVYLSITLMGIITIIYCTSGGIEAVVWSDVVQGFILVTGALIALVIMSMGTDGGFFGLVETGFADDKFKTIDFRLHWSEPVLWVVLLGGLANTLLTYSSDQSIIQRYMTTANERAARKSIWLNGIISVPITIIFFLLGTGLYTFYKSNPEDINPAMPNIDSVFPSFIMSEMPPGLAGLLIAAVFAAAMSTLSSNINSVAAAFTNDFYAPLARHRTDRAMMRVARGSGIVAGLAGTSLAIMLATWNIASLWDQFNTFLGLLTSGLAALFAMGIFIRRIGPAAAFIGMAGSFVVLLLVKQFTALSFLMYGFAGFISALLIGWLVSLIWPATHTSEGLTYGSVQKE
ncbi:MAG: sodium/solute symporter [Bacteroidales bacterium]|nr:sodium/solute symporter [Bacteroidales bacterium]MDD3872072.1 sodium/solute symporter [Bacteroidales bacterium]